VGFSRRSGRETAQLMALAVFLLVLAYTIVAWGQVGWRLALSMLIAAPAGVMLGYYLADKQANDRLYSIGLFSAIIVVAFIIAGLQVRLVIATFLALVAALILVAAVKEEG